MTRAETARCWIFAAIALVGRTRTVAAARDL